MSGTAEASGVSLHDDRPGASQVPKGAWAVLFTLLVASMMDMLDATAMGVAAPAIKLELGASDAQFQWINIGYLLSFSVLLLAGGRLGDILGRRQVFLTGLAGFTVTSVACAAAQSPGELIGARLLQGCTAALMIPQCVSMIRESFGQEHSAKAFGIFAPFISLSSALGPILGGALIDYASWRWVFLVNPPVCVAVFLVSLRVLPKVPPRSDRPGLDVVGMILCSLAAGLVVYPIIQGREYDWAWWTFAMMLAGAVVLAVFALHARSRRRRSLDAFVEVSLFRKRSFSGGTLTVFLFFGACSGAFIVSPLLLQLYIGWSPLHVGLTGAWWSLGTMSAMVAAPLLARWLGPRQVLQAGVLTQAVGMVLTALTVALNARETTHPGPHGPLLDTGLTSFNLAPALIVSGIGTGLFFVPFLPLVLAAVEDRELGLANGAINSLQQLGGAVAAAVFSTVIFNEVGKGASPYFAATLAYGLCACLLVVTWAASFTLGKSTAPHD